LGADLITKGVHNGIAKRHADPIVILTGGGIREVSSVIKGKKTIEETFPQGTKSDIERIERARDRYRAEVSGLNRASKESKGIARNGEKRRRKVERVNSVLTHRIKETPTGSTM
jgi:hypothetical protein